MEGYSQRTGNRAVGRRIRMARLDSGLTQGEVVTRLNRMTDEPFSRSWLANIEAGLRSIRIDDLLLLSRILDVAPGDLLDGTDGQPGSLARIVRPYEGKLSVQQERLLRQLLRQLATRREDDDAGSSGPA